MKNLKTVIAALGVFAMTIGSGFAMDNNPPTEPVKVGVETEIAEEAPQQAQPKHLGSYYYKDTFGNCIKLGITDGSMNCTTETLSTECWYDIDGLGTFVQLFADFVVDPRTNVCDVILPLYERTIP